MSDDTTPPQPPTPPPSGGYGAPPPPNPYGAPPAGGDGYNATDAIKHGWDRFMKNPTQLLIPTLIVAVIAIGVQVALSMITNATVLDTDCTLRSDESGFRLDGCDGPGFFTRLAVYAFMSFVGALFIQALSAGLIKAGLDAVDGKTVDPGQVFAYVTKGNVLVTAVLVSLATAIGTLLCYVPGLVIGFLTMFAMFFVVDKGLAPVEAIKASISLVTGNLGSTVVFFLLALLVIIAGAILCGVGLLAAIPIVLGAAAYTFRKLQGEPVAPIA